MTATAGRRSGLREALVDRGRLRVVLLTALLVATQVVVTVPNPLSLGSGKSMSLAEPPLALIAVLLVVWWLRHRDARVAADDRALVVGVLVFAAVLAAVTLLRAVIQHRTALSITSLENMTLGVTFYFMLRRRWFTSHQLVLAVHGLLVVAEVTALFRMVSEGTTLRLSAPLTNANMYVGFVLLVLPFLVWYAVTSSSRLLLWWTLGQMATIVAFVALSGSRFGGVSLIAELVAVFLFIDVRRWGTRALDIAASAAMCLVVLGAIIVASPETSADFQRTVNLGSALTGKSVPSAGDTETSPEVWARLPRVMGGPPGHWPKNPANVDRGNPDVDVWTPERSLRPRLWSRALHVIDEHWALGTGRPVLFYYGYGYMTPHSIAFDPVVSMGVFGAASLWALLLWMPLSLVRRVRSSRKARAVLLGALFLVACSVFQPLIDSVLVLALMYWGLFAVALDRPALDPVGLSSSESEPAPVSRSGASPAATRAPS